MIRRLPLLNGLAVLAVVCNHAVGWGFMAMFSCTDRCRPVTVPDYEQFGSICYYAMAAIEKLAVFSVPAFLLTSGFFVAYAARGSQSRFTWKMAIARIRNLLAPYLIWSVVVFAGRFLEGIVYGPFGYLRQLALGEAVAPYFYVPLLIQLYLLSPLLLSMAKVRKWLLLFISALPLVSFLGLRYVGIYGEYARVEMPVVEQLLVFLPPCSLVRFIFFFALGILTGLHLPQISVRVARFKWGLLAATIVLGLLAVIESDVVFRSVGVDLRGAPITLLSSPYAVSFILCFLGFGDARIPFAGQLHRIGRESYGIYLLHPIFLEFGARFLQETVPFILAYQILYLPLLVLVGVGGPIVFMRLVSKSPLRRLYRHLFG